MFLHLDQSPTMVNSTDQRRCGNAQSCLFKASYVSEQKISREEPGEETACRDRIVSRHRCGEGYKDISTALKFPKSTVAYILLKWKKCIKTRALSRKTCLSLPSWAEGGPRRTWWSPWLSSIDPVWTWGKFLLEQQLPFTSLGFMTQSCQTEVFIFLSTKGLSDCEKQYSLSSNTGIELSGLNF